jgi:hypothetical protein
VVEVDVPAGEHLELPVGRQLRVGRERERRPVAVGLELPAQPAVDVRVELHEPRRVESGHGSARHGAVAVGVRVLPAEHDAAALRELELRERQPRGDLVGLGESAPDALDGVVEPALEAEHLAVVAAFEGSVGHESSCRSRCCSSASSRAPQYSR